MAGCALSERPATLRAMGTSESLRPQDAEAAARARILVAGGYLDPAEIAEALVDEFSEPESESDQEPESDEGAEFEYPRAVRITETIWRERFAEQADWPEITESDAIEEAFEELEDRHIVARADFTCCANCGHGEIQDELDEDSIGYVFFHNQSTDRAVADGQLYLYYGACEQQRAAEVGGLIVAELIAAGLPVKWSGDPGKAIVVGPIEWRRRIDAWELVYVAE